MNKLHEKSNSDKHFIPREGQRDFLCSNKESLRCPSLDYKCTDSSSELVDKAFDLLFEELINIEKHGKKQINCNIRKGFEFQSRK